jgi:uncharacterized membrane protein YhfC
MNWVYIKLSVSIKLFMSCFIAQDCVCTASKLLCFKSSDIKYFKLKYGLSLYDVYIGIWLFVLYHKQK